MTDAEIQELLDEKFPRKRFWVLRWENGEDGSGLNTVGFQYTVSDGEIRFFVNLFHQVIVRVKDLEWDDERSRLEITDQSGRQWTLLEPTAYQHKQIDATEEGVRGWRL